MWYTHIYKEILFSLNKEILSYAATWMNLENIMLSKWNEPGTKRQMLSESTYLYEILRAAKFIETKQNSDYQGLESGESG